MKQRMKIPTGRRTKKQRNPCIACAILAALLCLLCACGEPASSGPDVHAPDRPGTEGGDAFSSETSGMMAGTAGSGGELIPLSSETDKGRYTTGRIYDQDKVTQLLCYVDYAAAREIPLCAQPSCAHNSDACTAFMKLGNSATAPKIGSGNAIFFVIMDGETGQDEIWTADPDGSGRRLLVRSTTGSNECKPIAEDGSYLYYFYGSYREENGEMLKSRLCLARVPLAGGESEDISSWEDKNDGAGYEFLGVSGREVALYRYEWGNPMENVAPEDTPPEETGAMADAQSEQQRQHMCRHSAFLLNVDTGAQRELGTWSSTTGSVGCSCLWENGRLYWCTDNAYGPIHWMDVDGQSGELAVLPEDPNDENACYMLDSIVQGKLLIDCFSPAADSTSRCAIDLSDDLAEGRSEGNAQSLTLRYLYAVSEYPVRIEGRSETELLVMYEIDVEYSPGFYEDGTPKENFSATSRYGMISYEDYFANRPNYRPVEMPYGSI